MNKRQRKKLVKFKQKMREANYERRKNSVLIVDDSGHIQKKAYNYYIEGMKGKINKADYWDMVDTVKSWTRLHKGKKLTLKGIMSRITENKREKMFLNAGVTLKEAAKEIGAKATDILNEDNWKDIYGVKAFKWNGNYYAFNFTYEGSVWSKL